MNDRKLWSAVILLSDVRAGMRMGEIFSDTLLMYNFDSSV